ncbi:MAG: S1-like domain-containing RNA-binding protein [Salinivirgaceae bacterium]|nr:S1-like domain-containing RNA-binding protein [Salinivirgaceae bacterium]
MAELGKYNELRVVKELDFGVYLDGDEMGEILLPIRQVPPKTEVDDIFEVFLYKDSEDRIIATMKEPYAIVGEFAVLAVVDVNKTGAWLDWGLDKHLLVPFREQKQDMEEGKSYLVYIYIDHETDRIAASSKLDKFLDNVPPDYEEEQEVDLLISNKSDIGYVAVINNLHSGLLYINEVFQPLKRGQKIKGYIKKIREDEKIDLMLQKPGYSKIDNIADTILKKIEQEGGEIALGDKSTPEDIYSLFNISKKDFKKAIGLLYKQKKIVVDKQTITKCI